MTETLLGKLTHRRKKRQSGHLPHVINKGNQTPKCESYNCRADKRKELWENISVTLRWKKIINQTLEKKTTKSTKHKVTTTETKRWIQPHQSERFQLGGGTAES